MNRGPLLLGALLSLSAGAIASYAGCGPADKPPSNMPAGITQPPARLTSAGVTSDYTFKEVNGLVSMEAEHASWWRGFDIWPGVSGTAMRMREPHTRDHSASACLRFKVYFSTPGKYAVWNFGRIEAYQYAGNEFSIQYGCEKQYTGATTPGSCGSVFLEDQAGHFFTRTYTGTWTKSATTVMHWSSYLKEGKTSKATGQLTPDESKCPCYEEADAKAPGTINVTKAGVMNIDYMAMNECSWIMDKIVLKRVDVTVKPTGTGPSETIGTVAPTENQQKRSLSTVASRGITKRIVDVKGSNAPSLKIGSNGSLYNMKGVRISGAALNYISVFCRE